MNRERIYTHLLMFADRLTELAWERSGITRNFLLNAADLIDRIAISLLPIAIRNAPAKGITSDA